MRVAVTGSAGFVGSCLVTCLSKHGHDVVSADIRAVPAIDMMNPEQLLDHLTGVDAIVHLAAEAYAERADEDPARAVSLNAVGTANVLAVARKLGARVIYGSTIWVYGSAGTESTPGQYDEHEPLLVTADRHVYTTSKLAGELLTRDFVSMYGLQATILRFGIPYGAGMRHQAVLPRFCQAVLRGEPIELADGGRQGRQFLDVRDLAEGQRAALEAGETGPIYNLVADEFTTIAEVAEAVMTAAGKRVPIVHRDGRRGDFSPGRLVSSRRAKRDLGWRANISFMDGVRDYWEWFRSNAPAEPGAGVAACSSDGARQLV
jgi:UDP-glucose 4-epimerase